jgi:hypothetical protein
MISNEINTGNNDIINNKRERATRLFISILPVFILIINTNTTIKKKKMLNHVKLESATVLPLIETKDNGKLKIRNLTKTNKLEFVCFKTTNNTVQQPMPKTIKMLLLNCSPRSKLHIE